MSTTASPVSRIPTKNPLIIKDEQETLEDAKLFFAKYKLEDLVERDVFIRGVLAVRDPELTAKLVEDIEREKDSLAHDKSLAETQTRMTASTYNNSSLNALTHVERCAIKKRAGLPRWQQILGMSRPTALIMVTCIFSAITQGWDQSSMSGANIQWPSDLNLHSLLLFGLINGAPFLSGCVLGCLISDPINDWRFGRRGALMVAGVFSPSAVLWAACVKNWKQLLIARMLLGVGMGAKAAVVPVYISEIAPKDIRGMLVMSWQLFDAFGIFLGSTANLIIHFHILENGWRFMLGASAIPAFIFLIFVPFCVESPRWLLKQGDNRVPDALRSFIQLHEDITSPIVACGDLYLTHVELQEENAYIMKAHSNRHSQVAFNDSEHNVTRYQKSIPRTTYWERWRLLATRGRIRRAMYASVCVMIAQQACGINLLAFLSPTLYLGEGEFGTSTISQKNSAYWTSFRFGLFNFVFTWAAFLLVDLKGRRFLLNISFPFMALFLFTSGLLLLGRSDNSRRNETPAPIAHAFEAFMLLFTIAYSIGEGPIAFVVASEAFPLAIRELGMSVAVFWNFLGASILATFSPLLLNAHTQTILLSIFGGLNLVSWYACAVLVPDTHRLSLESIKRTFDKSTWDAFDRQNDVLKYFWKRYILQNKDVERPPPISLYVGRRSGETGT